MNEWLVIALENKGMLPSCSNKLSKAVNDKKKAFILHKTKEKLIVLLTHLNENKTQEHKHMLK